MFAEAGIDRRFLGGAWVGAWVKSSHSLAKGLPLELVVLRVMLAAWH